LSDRALVFYFRVLSSLVCHWSAGPEKDPEPREKRAFCAIIVIVTVTTQNQTASTSLPFMVS